MVIYNLVLYFFIYGFLGWCIEVGYATIKEQRFVNRGFLNGPICPIYGVGVSVVVELLNPYKGNILLLYVASVVVVTLIEGITGFAMDKIFHHKWWDYSHVPLNIGGYVCVPFSLAWGVACVFIMKVFQPLVRGMVNFVPVPVGIVLIIILLGVLIPDICVTASTVLKLNRRLESMERVATELRELSDKVGVNIHENVMESMEKLEEVSDEQKNRIEYLKKRYDELGKVTGKASARLMEAFPKMESRNHKEILADIKKATVGRLKKRN